MSTLWKTVSINALFTLLVTVPALAESTTVEALLADPKVDTALAGAFAEAETAPVVITLDLGSVDSSRHMFHPAAKTDVHPVVFDLTQAAEAGSARLERQGDLWTFHGRFPAGGLEALLERSDIITVTLDTEAAPVAEKTSTYYPCVNTSNRACFGGHLSLTVVQGGGLSPIAARSSESAVFYTYNSSNWEIVGKVLDGCAINGHYWVYAAGATTSAFVVNSTDYETGITRSYTSSSAGNPIIQTQAMDCPH